MTDNVQTYLTELREIVRGMNIAFHRKRQLYSDIVAIGSDKIGYLARYSKKLIADGYGNVSPTSSLANIEASIRMKFGSLVEGLEIDDAVSKVIMIHLDKTLKDTSFTVSAPLDDTLTAITNSFEKKPLHVVKPDYGKQLDIAINHLLQEKIKAKSKSSEKKQPVVNGCSNQYGMTEQWVVMALWNASQSNKQSPIVFELLYDHLRFEGPLKQAYKRWGMETALHNLYKKQEENNKKDPKERKAEPTVYFVVDDQQVADVHDDMQNGSKPFMENRDMPIMAVVIDDEGTLGGKTFEVEINGEDHKVQAIGFLAATENWNYTGVSAVSGIRSNAVQQWNDRDLSGQLDRHVVTADIDGKEQAISTILYQVKNADMDQMLSERFDQRWHMDYKPYARADEEQYKLRTQLEDRYVAVAARDNSSTWTEEQIRQGMRNPDSQIYKAAVKELLETEGVLGIEIAKSGEYIQLTINGHEVIVTPMGQTVNANNEEWLDVLMGKDTDAIINFNYFTKQFHHALASVLFNGTRSEQGLVFRLREAKDAAERQRILKEYRNGYTDDGKKLYNALGNWIYLSSNVEYTLDYNEESGDLSINIESGFFADEESYTKVNLITFNVEEVASQFNVSQMVGNDNDNDEEVEEIDFGKNYTAQFLQNLLLNKNHNGFRQLKYTGKIVKFDEEKGVIEGGGDRTLAHWQLDYHSISHVERGDHPETTYYDGTKYVKQAIVKKLCHMIYDGLLFVNADTITPSTYVPVLANPYSYEDGGFLKLGDITKKIRDAEQHVRDEKEEQERKKNAAKAHEDDDTTSGTEYNTVDKTKKGLRDLSERQKINLHDDSHNAAYYEDENGHIYIRVTSAMYASQQAENGDLDSPEMTYDETTGQPKGYLMVSSHIGSAIDGFFRGILRGEYSSETEDLTRYCANYTHEQLKALAKQFEEFRQEQSKKGIELIDSITVGGTVWVEFEDGSKQQVAVAGTLDIIGIDREGKIHVYDMKTLRNGNNRTNKEYGLKWSLQLSLYKQLLEQNGFAVFEELTIIPISTFYARPKGELGKNTNGMADVDYYENDKSNDKGTVREHQLVDKDGKDIILSDVKCNPEIMDTVRVFDVSAAIGVKALPLKAELMTESEKQLARGEASNVDGIVLTGDRVVSKDGDKAKEEKKKAEGKTDNSQLNKSKDDLDKAAKRKAEDEKKKEQEEEEKKRRIEEARREGYTLKPEVENLFLDTNSSWEQISETIEQENSSAADNILKAIKECCIARWKQNDMVEDWNTNYAEEESEKITWDDVEKDFDFWFNIWEQRDPNEINEDDGSKVWTDEEIQKCRRDREEILKCKKTKTYGY